jgi:hypothetical protein
LQAQRVLDAVKANQTRGDFRHLLVIEEILMDWRDLSVIQRLELFRERAEELGQARFLRNTLMAGYELKIEARLLPDTLDQYETTITISAYDAEDLRSFLTFFRRFVLQRDPVVYLFSIYNLCHQYLTNETHKAYLVRSRQIALEVLRTSAFQLKINEQDMTPELVSDIWINGWYFHDNIDHLLFLRALPPETYIMLNLYFFDYLRGITRQILYTSDVVNVALNEELIRPS